MFLLYVYLMIAIILVSTAVVYQGYCDAKGIRNKLAKLATCREDSIVIIAAIIWPITLMILAICLIVLIVGFPFWCTYQWSKKYFSKENK